MCVHHNHAHFDFCGVYLSVLIAIFDSWPCDLSYCVNYLWRYILMVLDCSPGISAIKWMYFLTHTYSFFIYFLLQVLQTPTFESVNNEGFQDSTLMHNFTFVVCFRCNRDRRRFVIVIMQALRRRTSISLCSRHLSISSVWSRVYASVCNSFS